MTMTEHVKIGPYVCDVVKHLDDGVLFTHPIIHPNTIARAQWLAGGKIKIIDTNPMTGQIRSYTIN